MGMFTFLVAVLISGTAIQAFPVQEVPPQCVDPTFACQDLANARLCGVVKTCANDIWATMSAPEDNDEICDICKEMVKEARDQLLSNMTQEEIKEVFEGSCKLIPIKFIANACIKVVDDIIPQLVEMLASRMDPNMVCTVSGLCNMVHRPMQQHFMKLISYVVHNVKADNCDDCTKMVTDLQTFLHDTPESDVKSYVEKFCDKEIPSYVCDLIVGSDFAKIYNYILNTSPKDLCGSVGICPKSLKCIPRETDVKDDLTCEFCEHVLEHIKEMIIANTTKEEFRTALLNFCSHMGSFSKECTSLVNDYYDMLFDFIKGTDVKGVCTFLSLCTGECETLPLVQLIPAFEQRKMPLIKLQPAMPVSSKPPSNDFVFHPLVRLFPATPMAKKEMKEESNDIFESQDTALPIERFNHPVITFERDTECAFCRAISFYIEQDLNGDRSKAAVQKALNEVCGKWVTEYPDHCRKLLEKYSGKLENAISGHNGKLDGICLDIDVCVLDDSDHEVKVKVVPPMKDSPFCDMCKETMNEIEKVLKDPSTKDKLEDFLDKVCSILPKSIQKDCINFMNQNADALLNILEQELTADNVCPALGLCPSGVAYSVPKIIKDLECDVCKEAVSTLRQNIEDPTVKTVFLTFLEEGCERLPGSIAQECKDFVDKNIDTIIGVIITELDPDTICSLIKMCPAPKIDNSEIIRHNKVKSLECELCKEVVAKLEDMLKDNKTEDEIRDALDRVCSYLPKSMSDKCKTFVDTYAENLIRLLADDIDPDMICAALKACPAKAHFAEWLSRAKDLECQGCQYALHFVQQKLMDTKTQGEVKSFLKKICNELPKTYADNCDGFVDEYGAALLVLIAQEIDPSVLCQELKLCTNGTKLFEDILHASSLHPFQMDECSVCTTVVDYLDKLLEEDDIDKEITEVIEKVCNVVPFSFKQKCAAIIETYGPYILQMIGQMANSRQICQDIDLCARASGQVHLLGGHKCTYGPSYWCASTAHAAACKAEGFCKLKVWKK